ncbi:membrane protease YdiL (CAAX protease family) [Cytobacillus eiseniae]|uniref:Membrane protease YdiL (CAAX protease family) n=1 Tax=Cytobacillus eiseniae TaxID=762947 RepID=A0ABS4RJK4_9BACI|nr:CPBP family intramembrane glutamic endopeptidase [Cytobacillus eiseniae]MBP2243051.1 membrane protease YdiL (CAAX protease family) [Cytobacillus eiseniae]
MKKLYWILGGILVSLLINMFVLETTIYKQPDNSVIHVFIFLLIGLYLLYFQLTERLEGIISFTFPIILFCLTPVITTMMDGFFKNHLIWLDIFLHCIAAIIWTFILLKLTDKVPFHLKARNSMIIMSLVAIVFLFIFQSIFLNTYKTQMIQVSKTLHDYSSGLFTFNLVFNFSSFLIFSLFLFLILPSSFFKPVFRQVVNLDKMKVGFVYLFIIYIFSNLFVVGVEWLSGQSISSLVVETDVFSLIGRFIGFLFGVSLFEEAIFRLFLPVLLVILLRNFIKKHAIILAILISSILFAFVHTISDFGGFEQLDYAQAIRRLLMLFLSGQTLIYLYIVTKNLWIPIIIHALNNYGLPLFSFSDYPTHSFGNVVWVTMFILIVFMQHGSRKSIRKVNIVTTNSL